MSNAASGSPRRAMSTMASAPTIASARPPRSALEGRADLILLAGDLTTHGEPEQVRIGADVVRDVEVPVLTVLGNHDSHRIVEVCGTEVGIAGVPASPARTCPTSAASRWRRPRGCARSRCAPSGSC